MGRTLFVNKRKRLRIRRILLVCIALLLVATLVLGIVFLIKGLQNQAAAQAQPDTPPSVEKEEEQPPALEPVRRLPADFLSRNTKAPRIALYDISAQTLLYVKNGDEKCAPASLTKLMTAIVALETADLDTVITAGNELYLLDPESSRAGLYIGHKMTLKQALQGLLLKSGNDAAYIIAAQLGHLMDESVSGQDAIDLYCQKMTEKAKELGCTDTTFRNPDGIDKDGHETTANDLLKISLHALSIPFIAETVADDEVTTTLVSGQTKTWKNSNKLLPGGAYAYAGACGMKTGTTDGAGNCLISCATRDGRRILCILLGAEKDSIRYSETIELLNLGFF
jgi:D-alanyl-D-alanine carboxypeptidase (penicillin-binding protein 5/6)